MGPSLKKKLNQLNFNIFPIKTIGGILKCLKSHLQKSPIV